MQIAFIGRAIWCMYVPNIYICVDARWMHFLLIYRASTVVEGFKKDKNTQREAEFLRPPQQFDLYYVHMSVEFFYCSCVPSQQHQRAVHPPLPISPKIPSTHRYRTDLSVHRPLFNVHCRILSSTLFDCANFQRHSNLIESYIDIESIV